MTVDDDRQAHHAQLAEYDDVLRQLRELQCRVSRALDRCAQRRGSRLEAARHAAG